METVVVTGASRGIGLGTALGFARAGYKVYAGMSRPGDAPQLGETATREGLPIEVVTLDVDSDASVAACFAKLPRVDVLVNNGG